MSVLARSLYTYRFLALVNRVCLIQPISCLSDSTTVKSAPNSNSIRSCDFEVFGTVQGVFFRQNTQEQAKQLNLVGWVQNTARETVVGHMQGQTNNVDQMKTWLQKTGSPASKITKTVFTNEKSISKLTANAFDVRR